VVRARGGVPGGTLSAVVPKIPELARSVHGLHAQGKHACASVNRRLRVLLWREGRPVGRERFCGVNEGGWRCVAKGRGGLSLRFIGSSGRPRSATSVEYLRCRGRTSGLCRHAGFKRITFRGDTDFTQTRQLDGWDAEGVRFIFGCSAYANLIRHADALSPAACVPLVRRPPYTVQTESRQRPVNVKAAMPAKSTQLSFTER
jgi:hypothetical protein